ncbi:melanocyte-stimulating hormone receptor-like [Oculina patagonica]
MNTNESLPSQDMIPPACSLYVSLGGMLPPSATEAKAFLIFLAVINIVTCPFTAALNTLVIIAVKTKARLRANKPNILLACLATTDLMVGVIVQPLFAALLINLLLGKATAGSCALQNVASFVSMVLCNTSLIHLALISGERYLAMKHTFAYSIGLVTEARLLIGSALVWFFSLIFHISFFVNWTVFYVIIYTFISLSLAIITFCQITVYGEVRRHEREISTQQVTEEARQKFLKDKKAFKLTAVVISVLFVCYGPNFVFRLILIKYQSYMSIQTVYACLLSTVFVTILNSLLNPLIYSVRMRQFRVAFIELTCRTVNIAEAEEIEMRVFSSRPNAVARFEAGPGQQGDQQNAEQATVNNPNNNNNEMLTQQENHIEPPNLNCIAAP